MVSSTTYRYDRAADVSVAPQSGETALNKRKLVAWHKHLVKGRKHREQRLAKAAVAAPAAAAPASKR